MSNSRSFGPVAEQMKSALERYSKEELVDLLTHIVKTYVVEGTLPLKPEVGGRTDSDNFAGLSFPQLVLHMQMHLDHREWTQFSVSGEDVWVTNGSQRINLTGRPSSIPDPPPSTPDPPAAAPAERPGAGPRGRGAPAAPANPPTAEGAPPGGNPNAPRPPKDPFTEDVQATERFGMLEID